MPNKKSAIKRVRQNERRRERNRAKRSEMRTAIKNVRKATDSGEVENVDALLVTAQKRLGKAAKTNLVKKATASRIVSRLARATKRAKEAQTS